VLPGSERIRDGINGTGAPIKGAAGKAAGESERVLPRNPAAGTALYVPEAAGGCVPVECVAVNLEAPAHLGERHVLRKLI
jgi:hypothetical protein